MAATRRAKDDRGKALSELEGCVLGHLWKHGPCTAYAVRKEMLESPSTHWSGSAGAIYPLLERLESRGLVASRHAARGDRQQWEYELSPRGRELFQEWLAPPLDREVISIAPDPLRTRMHFLGALTPSQRAVFLAEAREKLAQHLDDFVLAADADAFDHIARDGGLRATRARIEWLAQAEKTLAKELQRAAPGRRKAGKTPRVRRA